MLSFNMAAMCMPSFNTVAMVYAIVKYSCYGVCYRLI